MRCPIIRPAGTSLRRQIDPSFSSNFVLLQPREMRAVQHDRAQHRRTHDETRVDVAYMAFTHDRNFPIATAATASYERGQERPLEVKEKASQPTAIFNIRPRYIAAGDHRRVYWKTIECR